MESTDEVVAEIPDKNLSACTDDETLNWGAETKNKGAPKSLLCCGTDGGGD